MSEQALAGFMEAMKKDQALAEGLMQAVGDREGIAACEVVAAYAAVKGYGVTADDVAAHQAAAARAAGERELSEAELDSVAGGFVHDRKFQDGFNTAWNHAVDKPSSVAAWMSKW